MFEYTRIRIYFYTHHMYYTFARGGGRQPLTRPRPFAVRSFRGKLSGWGGVAAGTFRFAAPCYMTWRDIFVRARKYAIHALRS